jgi:hypothetical protein
MYQRRRERNTPSDAIFRILSQMGAESRAARASYRGMVEDDLDEEPMTVRYADALMRITNHGWSEAQLQACIQEYQDLGVIMLNRARTVITFTQ